MVHVHASYKRISLETDGQACVLIGWYVIDSLKYNIHLFADLNYKRCRPVFRKLNTTWINQEKS